MNKNNYCAQYLSLQPKTGAYLEFCKTGSPAIHPHLMGIVPILEFQNLKKSGHSDFPGKKRQFGTGLLKIGLELVFF